MWKKDEAQPAERVAQTERPSTPVKSTPVKSAPTTHRATIGRSITIRGDVTGNEDLLIQGRVDGSVTLELHAIAVGSEGRVNADITGRVITIEGEVDGDLTAQEQIVLLGSARVQGDIKAPRVVLEDGATFRGLVDMGSAPAKSTDDGALLGSEASKENGTTKGAGAEVDAKAANGTVVEAGASSKAAVREGAGTKDGEQGKPPSPKHAAGTGSTTGAGSGSGKPEKAGSSPGVDPATASRPGSRKGKAAAGPTGRVGG